MKIMTRILFVGICSAVFVVRSIAQPAITGVSGQVRHGQSVQISGNSFGEKTVAAPLIWDDFENGTSGELVQGGWSVQRANEDRPIYTDVQKYGQGNLSLTNHIEPNENNAPGCQFCGAYQVVPEGYELYASYRFRFDVTGDNYAIMKLARLASNPNYGGTDYYNGVGTLMYQYQPHADWGYANLLWAEGQDVQKTCGKVPAGQWHRVEMYMKLSQPAGEANGAAWLLVNNELTSNFMFKDYVTLGEGYESKLHSLLLPLMLANPRNDGKFDMYVDDVYLDNSLARVEIGNASTWSATTEREIQIPSSWTGSAISVTVNVGSLTENDEVYLYVVDRDGVVNENGYPIQIVAVEETPEEEVVTGVADEGSIHFFPNPSGDELVVQGVDADAEVVVRDLSGKTFQEVRCFIGEGVQRLDLKNVPQGVYILEIRTDRGKYTKKFIRQ